MSPALRYLLTFRKALGMSASVALIAGCASTSVHQAAGASLPTTSAPASAAQSSPGAAHAADAALCRASATALRQVFTDIVSMKGMSSVAVIHMLNGDQASLARGDENDNTSPVVQALGALSQALTDLSGDYAGAMGQMPPTSADPTMTSRIQSLTTAVTETCTHAGVPLTRR